MSACDTEMKEIVGALCCIRDALFYMGAQDMAPVAMEQLQVHLGNLEPKTVATEQTKQMADRVATTASELVRDVCGSASNEA